MTPELTAVTFGLLSALSWGSGDFSGGLASRRFPAAAVAFWVNVVGAVLFALIALLRSEAFISRDIPWAMAAGASGALGLTCLYRAFSMGQMGLVAPTAAVVGAVIPVVVATTLEGLPTGLQLVGFLLGFAGVWLASQSGQTGRPPGLVYALLAGLGFGLYFVFIDRVEGLFWPSSVAKLVAFSVVWLLVLRARVAVPELKQMPLMVVAGVLDAGGNIFFLLATQAGRLDVAAVVSSLYPASTVLWAALLLHERMNRSQALGVALALVAIGLISLA